MSLSKQAIYSLANGQETSQEVLKIKRKLNKLVFETETQNYINLIFSKVYVDKLYDESGILIYVQNIIEPTERLYYNLIEKQTQIMNNLFGLVDDKKDIGMTEVDIIKLKKYQKLYKKNISITNDINKAIDYYTEVLNKALDIINKMGKENDIKSYSTTNTPTKNISIILIALIIIILFLLIFIFYKK